jgi:hypothetical protein
MSIGCPECCPLKQISSFLRPCLITMALNS